MRFEIRASAEERRIGGQAALRAVFVTTSFSHGGAERSAITVMNRLSERGHECHAVYVKSGAEQLNRIRLPEGGTVRCLNAASYLDRRALADFAAHIARVRPSAVIAANPYPLMYAALALRLARVPARLMVSYHSNRLLGTKEHCQMAIYRVFFWTADCTVFVCDRQMRYWRRRGVCSRRNEVIYNGVDAEEFRNGWSPAERSELRKAFGFSDADFVIGISALLRPEKNHTQLVDAIAMLRARGVAARALIIGDGPMRTAIESRARALGVETDIVITGFQRDVRPYVTASDAFALCSFTEAFPVAAIEAMSLGKPVVHSDVGGAAEMIVPGRNGFLFPVGDTKQFVEKLVILADRGVCAQMGRHARATVTARFSEKTMVDRYERTLLELCQRRSGAGLAIH